MWLAQLGVQMGPITKIVEITKIVQMMLAMRRAQVLLLLVPLAQRT